MKHTLTREQFQRGMKVLEEHGPLFKGLRPDQVLRVARSSGLASRMPKTKEGIALLMYGYKQFKGQDKMLAMVKEISADHDGQIKLIMGNVDQNDVDKAVNRVWTKPGGELYKIDKQLKSIY